MARNNLVTNIESKTKATRLFTVQGILFFILYQLFGYAFRGFINEILFVPYLIFNLIICGFLLLPSSYNKGRNNLESLYILLTADKGIYKPYNGEIYNMEGMKDED